MDSVTLTEHEFEVFKTLAFYSYSLQHPSVDVRNLREGAKHKILADAAFLSQGTMRNKFSSKEKKKLTDWHFQQFCVTFFETFKKFSEQTPKTRDKHYAIFKKWMIKICERKNWKTPIIEDERSSNVILQDYPVLYSPDNGRRFYTVDHISFQAHQTSLSERLRADLRMSYPEMTNTSSAVYDLVKGFYTLLQKGKWKSAWDMLSDSGKNNSIWKKDFRLFKRFYRDNRQELQYESMFELLHVSPNIFEAHVEYSHSQEFLSSAIDDLEKLSANDLDLFVESVNRFINYLHSLRRRDPYSVQYTAMLHEFFENDSTWHIYNKMGIGNTWDITHFASTKIKRVRQQDLCLCEYSDGNWIISNIRHGFTNEARLHPVY